MEETTTNQLDIQENSIDGDNLTDFDIFALSLPVFLHSLRQSLIISTDKQKPLDDEHSLK